MITQQTMRVLLAERPVNRPARPSDFLIERAPLRDLEDGEVLVRTIYLSLDPYMRGRMSAVKSYTAPVAVGDVMAGEVVGEVVASRDPAFAPGTHVLGDAGWQSHAILPGRILTPVARDGLPLSHHLGVLGMPGMTAYFALLDVCRPRAGETVLVSAAAGAVGQIVCQIAKLQGCRVVATAGADDKVAWLKDELGVDAAINYKGKDADRLAADLKEACPDGIDVFFDNVGGVLHDAVMRRLAMHGRIVICGTISVYDSLEQPEIGPRWLRQILVKRARIQGFLVSDYADRRSEFLDRMKQWLADGRVRYREDIAEGLERAPEAFIGMMAGANRGKQLVRVGAEDLP